MTEFSFCLNVKNALEAFYKNVLKIHVLCIYDYGCIISSLLSVL